VICGESRGKNETATEAGRTAEGAGDTAERQNAGPRMVAAAKRLLKCLNIHPDGGVCYGKNRFHSDVSSESGEVIQKAFDDWEHSGGGVLLVRDQIPHNGALGSSWDSDNFDGRVVREFVIEGQVHHATHDATNFELQLVLGQLCRRHH